MQQTFIPAAGTGATAGVASGPPAPALGLSFETFADPAFGLEQQERFGEAAGAAAASLLVWQAPRALVVGRADARLPGFAGAQAALQEEGWPVLVRRSGGLAFPITPGTLQFALVRRAGPGVTLDSMYRELAETILALLGRFGLAGEIGEKPAAFCPGRYVLLIAGRKVAVVSQHWRMRNGQTMVTCVATLIFDEDAGELARIVNRFYETAGGAHRCGPAAVTDMRHLLAAVPPHAGTLVDQLRLRLSERFPA